MATKKDIAECLTMLQAGIPKFVMNNDTPAVYLDILKDMPADMLKAATRQYLSERNEYTPVPTPGILREKAMDLQFLAAGVPSGGEAWGMVQDAKKKTELVFCEEGAALRESIPNAKDGYWAGLHAYDKHTRECPVCNVDKNRNVQNFGHPVIAEAVRRLGGLESVMTDNPMADRARFIDAYREIVLRERGKLNMTPEVREFVSQKAAQLDAGTDPVYLVGDGIDDVVQRMNRRKDLE